MKTINKQNPPKKKNVFEKDNSFVLFYPFPSYLLKVSRDKMDSFNSEKNEIKIHKLLNWVSESILKIGAASAPFWP